MAETHGIFCPYNKGDCYKGCEGGCKATRTESALRRVTKCVGMGHLADYDDELASDVREALADECHSGGKQS